MHDLQVFKVAASQASCAAVTRIRSKSRQWQPYRQHRPGPSIPLSLSDASKNSNNCHCCTHSAVAFLLELASADVGSDLHSSSRKSFSHASGGVLSCHAAPVYGPFFSCPPDLSRVSLSTSSLHLTFASCYLRPGLLSYHRLLRRLPVFTYLTWCSLSLLLSRFVPPPCSVRMRRHWRTLGPNFPILPVECGSWSLNLLETYQSLKPTKTHNPTLSPKPETLNPKLKTLKAKP